MSFMYRFINWINSRNRIAPATTTLPNTSMYISENDPTTVSFTSTNSTRTKRVHFADDCGEALENVHEVSVQLSYTNDRFHESLEEVYVDKHGILTAFLRITNLESGRKLLVRYTKNEWRTYETIAAHRVDQPTRRVYTRTNSGRINEETNENLSRDHGDSSRVSGEDDDVRYSFRFAVGCMRKLNHIELVVISTLNGAVDNSHDNSYRLNDPRCCVKTATNRRCVKSLKCW